MLLLSQGGSLGGDAVEVSLVGGQELGRVAVAAGHGVGILKIQVIVAGLDRLDPRLEQRMMELGIPPVPSGSAGASRDLSETAPTATEPSRETANDVDEEAIGGADVDQAGATKSPPAPAEAEERGASGDSHCRNVCELSEAICELEVRICGMSSDHAGEATYAEACERAFSRVEARAFVDRRVGTLSRGQRRSRRTRYPMSSRSRSKMRSSLSTKTALRHASGSPRIALTSCSNAMKQTSCRVTIART